MNKYFDNAVRYFEKIWEEINEIIAHLIGSLIILFFTCIVFDLNNIIINYLFSEEDWLITNLELASRANILILYLLYVSKSLLRGIHNLRD